MQPNGDSRQDDVLAALSAGRIGDARELLRSFRPDDPFVAVVEADLHARRMDGSVNDLRDLRDLLIKAGPARQPLVWWVDALIAERLIVDLDIAGTDLASAALASVPDDELPSALVLFVRARLRRAASARWMFTPSPNGVDRGRRIRDEAVVDFLRGGFFHEAVMTRVWTAVGEAMLVGHDIEANLARLLDARALLTDADSLWPILVDQFITFVGVRAGDKSTVDEAMERIRSVPPRGAPTVLERMVHVAAPLLEAPDQRTIDAVNAAVAQIDHSHLRWRWVAQMAAGAWLAEAGHPDCLNLVAIAMEAPGDTPLHDSWRDMKRWRYEIQNGSIPDVDEMILSIEVWAHNDCRGIALQLAGHLADLLAAAHGDDVAAPLRGWRPQDASAEPAAGLRAETALLAPAPNGYRASVAINVLCPVLEVTVDGRPEPVSDAGARLLAHLVVDRPGPRHVEQLGEMLWPGAPAPVARQRLNGLVHRLRRRSPALGALLLRAGETVELDLTCCSVDLVDFHAGCRAGGGDRLEMMASVRGNLCDVQFPYDEYLLEARHAFVAEWLMLATGIADDRARERLSRAASVLGVGDVIGVSGEPAPGGVDRRRTHRTTTA